MKRISLSMLGAPLCVAALAMPMAAQVYTTKGDGTTVNANIYESKNDVYLSGGPISNCNQNGLAPGTYYFQVTDPSGATLLSTDPIGARRVEVGAGQKVITSYTGVPSTHQVSPSFSACGSTLVQLMPYDDTPNAGGEYKLWLYGPGCTVADDTVTALLAEAVTGCQSKTDNFKVRTQTGCEPMCSDPPLVSITGTKFYDANTDGVQSGAAEVGIPGWRIEKEPPAPHDITYTDINGVYGFLVEPFSGAYTISEVFPGTGTWVNTTPLSGGVNVAAGNVSGPNFGNVCLGAGGGLTLGFWSNRNGEARFNAIGGLAAMVALNLRGADGSHFDPASYNGAPSSTAFRPWLLGATATNMAYMLSAQLAAMKLNVLDGKVNAGSLIYAPGTNSANAFGFATVGAIITEADTELGLHGLTLSGSEFRAYQEALKNALDKANNNQNFVQPNLSACPAFTTPY